MRRWLDNNVWIIWMIWRIVAIWLFIHASEETLFALAYFIMRISRAYRKRLVFERRASKEPGVVHVLATSPDMATVGV